MLGTVTVVVMTPNREEVGRTQFTYVDKLEEAFETILNDEELLWSFFTDVEERLCKTKGSGMDVTAKSDSFGEGNRNSTVVGDYITNERSVFALACVSQYLRKHFGPERVFYVHCVHHRNPFFKDFGS